ALLARRTLHGAQLLGHPERAPRERALRLRARRLHGRGRAAHRQVRGRRRRHAVPGRDRRHAAGAPGEAPARPPGARVHALLRAAVLTGGRTLVPEDFALAGQPRQPAGDALPLEEAVRRRLAELLAADATALPSDLHALLISAVERPLIEVVLERAGGNQV